MEGRFVAMPTYSLTVSYNGAPFSGFARQPGLSTVQGSLEEALELVFRRPIETTCAGRTDAGVHARGQVVSFDVDRSELRGRSGESLRKSLDGLTDDAIGIRSFDERPDGFSARFDAVSREYRYLICTQPTAPLFLNDFCWHLPRPLDLDAMRQAAGHLVGEHDFKSFCLAASAEGKPTCRNVMRLDIDEVEVLGEHAVRTTVVGNAFLHSMIRTIMGTLVAVGRGQRHPDWVLEVLQARDRGAAGQNAPAQGLVFWHVAY